jgi:predicted deacylase
MAIEQIRKIIYGDSPGKSTELNGFRIGNQGCGKKVYLQGALHSDEQPGIMALHHLVPLLFAADEAGQLNSEFVIFPMVNPIGIGNIGFGMHQGRYDLPSGVNFNRDWPDIYAAIEDQLVGKLGQDSGQNSAVIQQAASQWLTDWKAQTARQQLRKHVLWEAYNADYIFDLHCDDDSLPHIFCSPRCSDQMQQLSDWMGAAATMTSEDSGGGSFDEVIPLMWINAGKSNPDLPIPDRVVACTLELRGQADVFDEIGRKDATGLFGFFQSQQLIGGPSGLTPEPTPCPTPLTATEILRVDRPGLLAYKVELGEIVETGQVIADLIALDGDDAFVERTPILAGTSGTVISRNIRKYVWPGCSIAKIVGTDPLSSRGKYLLED